MKRTVRIVFVLILVTMLGSVASFAESYETNDWPTLAPELWDLSRTFTPAPFGPRVEFEQGPVDLPIVISPDETKALAMSPAIQYGDQTFENVNGTESISLENFDSGFVQAIPGSRGGSFMNEHRLAERSLRGTIKKLG